MGKGTAVELRASFLNRNRRRGVESRAVVLAPRDRPFWDTRELVADRQILADGREFILGAVAAAFADGYRIVCVGAASRFAPEPLASMESVVSTIDGLDLGDGSTYPIVVWMVKKDDELTKASVKLYEAGRNNEDIFFGMVRRGAIWVSISDVFLDVIHRTEDRAHVLRWFDSASRAGTIPVVTEA